MLEKCPKCGIRVDGTSYLGFKSDDVVYEIKFTCQDCNHEESYSKDSAEFELIKKELR